MIEVISTGPAMTRAIGAAVASLLDADDVVVLTGDLGTGKTVFAQGVAAGLGVTELVVSPTFALVREYRGRVPLHHLDVYRLDRVQEAIDLGLDELFDGAVTVIEWGEGVLDLLPGDRIDVTLRLLPPDAADDDSRALTMVGLGARWSDGASGLASAVARAVEACQEARC